MKHLRMLALVVAAAFLAPATASATQMTSPSGTVYTNKIQAESGTLEWHGSFTTIKCGKSVLSANIETHGSSVTAKGAVTSWTFSECNFPFKVLKAGTLEFHTANSAVNDGNGTITSSSMELTTETSIANCIFTTSNTDLGILTGSDVANAKWDINSATIPRTGHSVFCGSSSTLTGSYTVTTPSTLTVD